MSFPVVIQRIADAPWVFVTVVVGLVLLNLAAAMRLRHDRKLKSRAHVDRRRQPRGEADRRWSAKRLVK